MTIVTGPRGSGYQNPLTKDQGVATLGFRTMILLSSLQVVGAISILDFAPMKTHSEPNFSQGGLSDTYLRPA